MLFHVLFLLIVVTFFSFGILIFFKQSLIMKNDAIHQHIQVFARLHQYLIEFIFHPSKFGTWDWSLGNGTDWYNTFSYYALGDPLAYLMIFFGKAYTIIGYEFIILLRFILAGLSTAYFATKFSIKEKWIGIVAIGYLFSSFGVYALTNQSLFITSMIYLPLLIVSVEYFFSEKKFGLFVVVISLALSSNFYMGIILAEVVGIYAIVTYLYNYKNHNWWRDWLSLGLVVVAGIALAGIVLVPSMLYMKTSTRGGSGITQLFTFYPLSYYLTLFTLPFGSSTSLRPSMYWLQGSASAINSVGLFWIISNRKHNKMAFTLLLLGIVLLLFPASAVIMTLGNMPTNRWMFVLFLLTSLNGVFFIANKKKFDDVSKKNFLRWLTFGAILFLMAATILKVTISQILIYVVSLIILLLYIFVSEDHGFFSETRIRHMILFFVVLSIGSQLFLSQVNGNLVMLSTRQIKTALFSPTGFEKLYGKRSDARTEFDNAYLTKAVSRPDNTFLSGTNATSLYFSTANPSMLKFSKNVALATGRGVNPLANLDNRALLTDYFSVNQLIGKRNSKITKLPNIDLKKVNSYGEFYKNSLAMPMMWTPQHAYSLKTFSKANPVIRENILTSNSVAVKDVSKVHHVATTGLQQFAISKKLKKIVTSGKVIKTAKVRVENGNQNLFRIKVPNGGRSVVFSLPRVSNGKNELLLNISNLKHVMISRTAEYKDLHRDQPQMSKSDQFNLINNLLLNSRDAFQITAAAGTHKTVLQQYSVGSGSSYESRKNAVFNLGGYAQLPQRIVLHFSQPGTYSFKLGIYTQQLSGKIIKQLKQNQKEGLQNIRTSYKGISGTTNVSNAKWLTSNIPFSVGWRAKVNGKRVQVKEVNGSFVGLKLPNSGVRDKIKFEYQTPGLKVGAFISIFTLILLLITCGIKAYKLN